LKRAQSDEQKTDRKRLILSAAKEALVRQDYRDIRLQDLAEGLGLVKGTFYRYFPNKQDLFMSLYVQELEAWLDDWSGRLARGRADAEGLETVLLDSLDARPILVRLIGSFPGELEPELSEAGLRSYKRFMKEYLGRSTLALGPLLPGLGEKAIPLLISIFVLIQGAAPMCFPASRVAAMLCAEEEFAVFRFGLRELLSPLVRALFAAYFGEKSPG
jgi:AcrR family transcriptional regulator